MKNTFISYSLKNNDKNVQVIVTDNSGKTIKVVTVNNKTGTMTFNTSLLPTGKYHYSLITGDNIGATKTMTVNK
jgi:hypothetical protein